MAHRTTTQFTLALAATSLVLGCMATSEPSVKTPSASTERPAEVAQTTSDAPEPARAAMSDDFKVTETKDRSAAEGERRATAKVPAQAPAADPAPVSDLARRGDEEARPMKKAGKRSRTRRRPATLGGAVSGRASGGADKTGALLARKPRGPRPGRPALTAPPPPPTREIAEDADTLDTGAANFEGRSRRINAFTKTNADALSTFAIDVDTAAYSIARRTLNADRMPTSSLVRIEEMVNYFAYDYEAPKGRGELFSVQADGARSPVDGDKVLFRVGIQAKDVSQDDRKPANLVFLIDTSCSMRSSDKLGLTKAALKEAVRHLDERDQVAITTYAGGVRLVLKPTRGNHQSRINRAIDSLRSGGGTAMNSGLQLAYRQASKMLADGEVTRIIVCSDGDANIGATSPRKILKSIAGYVSEGVTLSTIGFGQGNYKDAMMEQLANKGNGNYYYIDSLRQAKRVFGRDLTKMLQDVAQDVKIQVEFNEDTVDSYRLVGYENRNVADRDFRNDKVDAGEIGAGHQVTALYELILNEGAEGRLATVRVRAKKPRGMKAKEIAFDAPVRLVTRPFGDAQADFRFATAVMGGSELLRSSPHAEGWSYKRVISIVQDTAPFYDEDRAEFLSLMNKAAWLSGEQDAIGMR